MEDLTKLIRDIIDFPIPGIVFKDITTLLSDPEGFKKAVDAMTEPFLGTQIDYVAGIESRGFIFGSVMAYKLGVGFTMIRKPGKLPYKTAEETYEKEYGTDSIQIHEDAFENGKNVLIVDDLLATGGTIEAVAKLVEKVGGNIVSCVFMIELDFLNGRDKLKGYDIRSLMHF